MNTDYIDTGKILVAYSPNGLFALDTNSEIFLEKVLSEDSKLDLTKNPGCFIADEWMSYGYGMYIWEGEIKAIGDYQYIKGEYLKTNLTSLMDGIEKVVVVEGKHRCGHCSKVAKYLSMESGRNFLYKDYYCDSCVPRGHRDSKIEINVEDTYKSLSGTILKGDRLKRFVDGMGEDESLIPLDKDGREFPCANMFFEDEGFDYE